MEKSPTLSNHPPEDKHTPDEVRAQEDTTEQEKPSKISRRGFLKALLGAGALASGLTKPNSAEAKSDCGRGATMSTYMGRSYCAPIFRGHEPPLTPENIAKWSQEHDCLSNYVQTGDMIGSKTCRNGNRSLEKYLAGNGKLTDEGCAYFQWLDRRWDRAYRKGIPGIPKPPWREFPNRYNNRN